MGDLTAAEKQLIGETWGLVRQDMEGNGVGLLVTLFMDYPEHMKYFKFENTSDRRVLENDPQLKLHALRVMKEIDHLIENIENTDVLVKSLQQNAQNHKKRAISKEAYDHLRLSYLKILRVKLGDACTKDLETAWDKALKALFKIITDYNGCKSKSKRFDSLAVPLQINQN